MDPACEVNERGTRDRNDGNEVINDCDLPLDLALTEQIEVGEDLNYPEQTKIEKGKEPVFLLTMETRQSKREMTKEIQPVW